MKQSEAYVKGDKYGSEVIGEASTVLQGLLSPEDKTKLDSIPLEGIIVNVRTEVLDYLVIVGDYFILVDATGGDVTISLPSIPLLGVTYVIKRIDNSVNNVTLDTSDAALIDGAVSIPLTEWDSLAVCSNATDWFIQ